MMIKSKGSLRITGKRKRIIRYQRMVYVYPKGVRNLIEELTVILQQGGGLVLCLTPVNTELLGQASQLSIGMSCDLKKDCQRQVFIVRFKDESRLRLA